LRTVRGRTQQALAGSRARALPGGLCPTNLLGHDLRGRPDVRYSRFPSRDDHDALTRKGIGNVVRRVVGPGFGRKDLDGKCHDSRNNVNAIAALRHAVVERSGGNPLHLEEIVRDSDHPSSQRELVFELQGVQTRHPPHSSGAFVKRPLARGIAGLSALLLLLLIALIPSALADGIGLGIAAAVVEFVVQQVESQVIAPLVMKRAVKLHPATVILALLAGGALAGIWGLLLAVPAVAVIKVIVGHVWATRVLGAGEPITGEVEARPRLEGADGGNDE
jgi:hypothetical protein